MYDFSKTNPKTEAELSVEQIEIMLDSVDDDKLKIIALLKKHGIQDTEIIEDQNVALGEIIPTLLKAKVRIPESFFRDLADHLYMPFAGEKEIENFCQSGQGFQWLTVLPYRVIEEYFLLPLEISDETAKIALANPLNHKAMMILKSLLGKRKLIWYAASSETVARAVQKVFGEIHVKKALKDLYYRNPDESAYRVLFPNQKYWLIGTFAALLVGLSINSVLTIAVLLAAINVGYFVINPIKIYISLRGFQPSKKVNDVSKTELEEVDNSRLPVYTVLVPVYKEARVLPQVMQNIYRMDYPKDKLDVKLLLEEDDEETLAEAKKLGLFGQPEKMAAGIPAQEYRQFLKVFEPLVIPEAEISTKPRACNYGLLRAKGKYCVIYDAEDNPDKDQLKKAAVIFSRLPEEVLCLQSKLNFYNAKEDILTKWFSIEYSYWYEFYLQGLDRTDIPIPLGGTSNHFRTSQLRAIGGWDPYNVTEDADIGIRLSRKKLKTEMLETYTYEEAPTKVRAWIRQRSRWFKGHVQTYLVHMRHPIKLLKDLGLRKFLMFQLTFGGSIFMPLINPVLWAITLFVFLNPWTQSNLFLSQVRPIFILNLIIGNATYVAMYLAACIDRRNYKSLPPALAMPAYWALISVAAFRGLYQLATKPFYWEKTTHGISKLEQPACT
jgi:hypothetical protein